MAPHNILSTFFTSLSLNTKYFVLSIILSSFSILLLLSSPCPLISLSPLDIFLMPLQFLSKSSSLFLQTLYYILSDIYTLPTLFQCRSYFIPIIYQSKEQILYFSLTYGVLNDNLCSAWQPRVCIMIEYYQIITSILKNISYYVPFFSLIISLDLYHTCLNSSELPSSKNQVQHYLLKLRLIICIALLPVFSIPYIIQLFFCLYLPCYCLQITLVSVNHS